MPQHVSIIQQIGVAALTVATVAWVVGLVRVVRRDRHEVASWRASQVAGGAAEAGAGMPGAGTAGAGAVGAGTAGAGSVRPRLHGGIPRQSVPATENVDLTPDERAAFAGLIRQLDGGPGRS